MELIIASVYRKSNLVTLYAFKLILEKLFWGCFLRYKFYNVVIDGETNVLSGDPNACMHNFFTDTRLKIWSPCMKI